MDVNLGGNDDKLWETQRVRSYRAGMLRNEGERNISEWIKKNVNTERKDHRTYSMT
jgi:hypothetical protein